MAAYEEVDFQPGRTYKIPVELEEHVIRWGSVEVTVPEDIEVAAPGNPGDMVEVIEGLLNEAVSSADLPAWHSKVKQWDVRVDSDPDESIEVV